MSDPRRVYYFGDGEADGHAELRTLLGGKGANLAEMTRIGIPVPPGFTITTEVCNEFLAHGERYPEGLEAEVDACIERLEKSMGARFGDADDPLLVSVRSGARASMPGMMDTVLNLGLNAETVAGLARRADDERFAWDCYRRFVQMYGDVVLGVEHAHFEHAMDQLKEERGASEDLDLGADDLRELAERFRKVVADHVDGEFPDEPRAQLWGAIGAVFSSWNNKRARTYRALHNIPGHWGTAVNVQVMVFGNLGETSATGVAFTRDPATGEKLFYGEWLPNAQGEDVVAGIRTPRPLRKEQDDPGTSLEEAMPELYRQLEEVQHKLEQHYRDMQDLEFTIQQGKLYVLQTRNGKRTGMASVRIAVDMEQEGLIDAKTALVRVEPEQLTQLLAPVFEVEGKRKAVDDGRVIARGLNAGPGAASGRVVFSPDRAAELGHAGEAVILVRHETSPEDVAGMQAARGILTARGGMTSHAAVVARGMGKSCIVGCGELQIDYKAKRFTANGHTVAEGDWLSIDGTTGEVIEGRLETQESEIVQVLVSGTLSADESPRYQQYAALMKWADEHRRLRVRTNADTPEDARRARAFGAQGIGLCRTEHMFFADERIPAVRKMILADDADGRAAALDKLLPMQESDFRGILAAMSGLPVTIRLLDPPLHEFLPHEGEAMDEAAEDLDVSVDELRRKVEHLRESNPMLGHRGCRLGITYPEIYRMQVRAIFQAACALAADGVEVEPEVMLPLIGTVEEYRVLEEEVRAEAEAVMKQTGQRVDYLVGTMMEVPRACLVADDIARSAEFFSFGTNDLTQMTFGFSRDDAGTFLPTYVQRGILPADPFQALDRGGVGRLVELACKEGREARESLKLGICGEHGGEPSSVTFCHEVGLDYVSCSPYRVPLARLAAARAALGVDPYGD